MQNNFLEFGTRQNIKHAPSVLYGLENGPAKNETDQTDPVDTIGGIFRDGSCGWIVVGAHIEIVSLKNGNRIADYTFGDRRYSNTFVAFVVEVHIDQINTNLLAIGVHCSPTTSCIYLFAVDGSRIIHAIEIEDKVTSCCFINSRVCADSALNSFDGCIIVGTETGKILIVDLFVESCLRVLHGSEFYKNEPKICKIISATTFKRVEQYSNSDDIGFGVQLEDVTVSGPALSILCLAPLLIVAVGFEDGKMVLYDLGDLDAFHIAHPPDNDSPLEKLTFIEPADDPRACVYVWSFHSNSRNAIAVLHSLTYEMKIVRPDGNGFVYKNFERCTPRLTMPIFEKHSKPVACQSITKYIVAEENFLTLCLLSWTSATGAFVCVFDLNQWYKQQLPDACDWRSSPTFLAIFPLGKQPVLDVWMNGVTVTPFSSLNRPEEHFYPSSLSFDCMLLTTNGSAKLHWLGLQNEALEHLNHNGPYAILEPNRCFAEMVRASLIPQFTDYSYDMNQSLKSKREFLLSIALEYNCVNLLKRCANSWADGSHLSKNPSDGMSLSTLTDWIWNRATSIKDCCNEMCIPLFDHSGNSIEPRSQKVLLNFSRQLKRLYLLMDMIVTTHEKYIPGDVLDTLQSQRNSICMATEYQDVLQWLLNVGLLPEVSSIQPHKSYAEYRDSSFDAFEAVPYPYGTLKSYYTKQRRKFCEMDRNFLVPKTNSCRILYVDAFIEHECNSAVLRSEWKKESGDGLYPPASLQTMLRTLLVPGVSTERKYMLFVYLFMDLSSVLREEHYDGVIKNLIKFPAVFKMDPGLIKVTQAFWNLDHGEYELAVDEIISPLAQDQNMSVWQRELLIGALILNDRPNLALRALHAPGSPIAASLEIRTLLANDLVADAFQVQRMKRNRDLLFEFFQMCHEQRKWHFLLNLSLNDKEEECLGEFLRSIESSMGENIHFIYLLRRSKYIEAVTFIDDLHHKKRSGHLDLDTSNTILSTYRSTMAPPIRQFSDLYYKQRDNINVKLNSKAECPKPLSCQLSQRKFDIGSGVYHQSLLHTEQTSVSYWENQEKKMCGLAPSNVPFLYGLRVNSSPNGSFDDRVCYPELSVPSHKRRMNDSLESAVQAPTAKRQRLECSTVNTTLLTSFKGTGNQSKSILSKSLDDSIEMEDDPEMLQTTLSTPVVQSQKKVKKPFSLLERIGTPQSILKSRSSYRGKSVSSVASRRSVDSDERSIRFNLPDDIVAVPTSTPMQTVIPDVFNFGISQRPSIHSDRTPSQLLINDQTTLLASKDIPTNSTITPSKTSPGRKRLRSISPEASSRTPTCVDVTVERSYEPQSRQLFATPNESINEEPEDIATESINKQPIRSTAEPCDLEEDSSQETVDLKIATTENVDEVAVHIKSFITGDSASKCFGQSTAMYSAFTAQAPTNEQTKLVERIIPIEVEPRPPIGSQFEFGGPSSFGDTKEKRRSSIGLNVSNLSFPSQRNILTDSSYYESSYVSVSTDGSPFKQRNLLTSTLNSSDLTSPNTTKSSVSSKGVGKADEIETVQIEDSDDDSDCDLFERFGTTPAEQEIAIQGGEKAQMSSTPFTLKSSPSVQFDANSSSFSSEIFRKKNILTDSTFKESSYHNLSMLDRSSMYKSRNILTDSTYKDQSVTSSEQSTLTAAHKTIEEIGNSVVSEKGNDSKPILIDITERKTKDSTSPDFNDEYSNDIYDLSSEADVGLQDDDYDVDDYESESEDDVIDISSGTEDVPDPPIKSKGQNTSAGQFSLPPCNTIGKKDRFVEANVPADVFKSTIPMDESKCSDVSFMTASENSVKHLTELKTASLHPEENDSSLKDVALDTPVPHDFDNAEEKLEKDLPSDDFIGVLDVNKYGGTQLGQNQVTITYELQENLLDDNEINADGMGFTMDYGAQNDLVSSDLNNALLLPESFMQTEPAVNVSDTVSEVIGETEGTQNLNDAVIDSQDTITAVPETQCAVIEEKSSDDKITTSGDTLIQSQEVSVASELISTTCDLNAGIIVDTITFPDTLATSELPSETNSEVIAHDQNVTKVTTGYLADVSDVDATEVTSGILNEAILCDQTETVVEPMEVAAVDQDMIGQNIEEDAQTQVTERGDELVSNKDGILQRPEDVQDTQAQFTEEGLVLNIDEILESAVVPEIQQIVEENVQSQENDGVLVPETEKRDEENGQQHIDDVFSQTPSTSADALKKSAESKIGLRDTPKRRLRSNSETVETPPVKLTRKRSSSSMLSAASTPNESVASPATRITRAKSETKSVSNQPVRARGARASSEIKATRSEEHPPLSMMDSMESDGVDTITKKVKRAAGRNVSSPVNTPEGSSLRVTRSRTRSIAEDDDNVSVVSEVSQRSTRSATSKTGRSTRSTRGKSNVAVDEGEDDGSSTSKKTRAKPLILPSISEDLIQEETADSQYEDDRRLTRRQKKFMAEVAERSKLMVAPPTMPVSRKRTRRNSNADADDDDISDTASVASSKTNASARSRKSAESLTPVRQSKRLLEKEGSVDKKSIASIDSDTESVVSAVRSTRSRRRSTSSKK
ncbi:protein ELYS [Bradysia coprophila]|uniref:protein ELYS n=1 Tax=Bradysia coprophila TaxID=38358 RepID=UPI00187D890A|nr:protein ELYS [Bradysia coprophila]